MRSSSRDRNSHHHNRHHGFRTAAQDDRQNQQRRRRSTSAISNRSSLTDEHCTLLADKSQQHEQENEFDVNSFLHKTLSNYQIVDQAKRSSLVCIISGENQQLQLGTRSKVSPAAAVDCKSAHIAASSISRKVPPVELCGNRAFQCKEQKRSASSSTSLSLISAASSNPMCRICHESLPKPVMSPCRCSGTMQYVHTSCLVHWLEISTKKMTSSPRCELCGYYYRTKPMLFNLRAVHLPHLDSRDRILHTVFLLVFAVMIGSALLSILYLQADPRQTRRYRPTGSLSGQDVTVLTCSVLFFLAFFAAVFTQYRAEASLCRLLLRCWLINRNWRIRDYDSRDDPQQQQQLLYINSFNASHQNVPQNV